MKSPQASWPPSLGRGLRCLCWVLFAACAARAERLPVRVYTTADGLGSGAVNWVTHDSRGFLWFGTRDGLSRFDGLKFTTYRVGRDASPSIMQIIERRRGDYMVVTQTGGLYRFDSQTHASSAADADNDEALTLHAELLADNLPGILYEDRAGRLWMVGGAPGLFRLDESGGRVKLVPVNLRLPGASEGPEPIISRVIEARDGSLWMSTGSGLVRRAPDGRIALHRMSSGSPMNAYLTGVCEDADGRIWVGSRRGLYVIKPRPLSDPAAFDPPPLADSITRPQRFALPEKPGDAVGFVPRGEFDSDLTFDILQTSDGRVWVTNDGGLSVFDGRELRSYGAAHGFGRKLGMMAEDSDGNLWLSGTNGAVKLVTRGLTTYGKDDGLGARVVNSLYQSPAGEFYVVGGDWQVSRLDGDRFKTARPSLSDAAGPIWTSNAAFLDSTGAWWFLTEKRLYRFDRGGPLESLDTRRPSAVYHTGPGFNNGAFYRMFEDSRGRIWVSTRTGEPARMGLSLWRRETGNFQHFTEADGFPAGRAPSAFCEDGAGNIWVGFYHGGLVRYAGDRFTTPAGADEKTVGSVLDMHLDRAGRLWIATVGGLLRVDDPSAERPAFISYTTAAGLSSNNVRAVTEDAAGRIYAGTVRGVDRLSPDTGRVKHYTLADGLADDFVTVAFRDRDGALWFGTQNGLSKLAPDPDPPAYPPPIFIGALRVAGVKQRLSEVGQTEVAPLELDYTQANLQIDFFGFSFAPAERMRYQHKLEGADDAWSAPAAERTVSYANLAPGAYRFLVRAVNADGVASSAPAVVAFRIAPPVWARWWFGAGLFLLFGAGVYTVARAVYLRKLELERVRTRIASDLHDDIGASLTRISMLSEVARRQNGGADSANARRLTQIAEDARGVIDSMSDIVWAIDPRRDDLASVFERVRSFASDTLGAAGVRWHLTTAPLLERHHLTPEQRRALYLIFKEAVSNIARHADCRTASCEITIEGRELVAVVEDDGRGLPLEQKENGRGGRGLANMRARAAELGGRLEIESRPGEGTRLRLRLPLRADMNMLLRLGRG